MLGQQRTRVENVECWRIPGCPALASARPAPLRMWLSTAVSHYAIDLLLVDSTKYLYDVRTNRLMMITFIFIVSGTILPIIQHTDTNGQQVSPVLYVFRPSIYPISLSTCVLRLFLGGLLHNVFFFLKTMVFIALSSQTTRLLLLVISPCYSPVSTS